MEIGSIERHVSDKGLYFARFLRTCVISLSRTGRFASNVSGVCLTVDSV